MTQRTYKGRVAPDWAEYVVFGPRSGDMYWANDDRRQRARDGAVYGTLPICHVEEGWRREELDPLPSEELDPLPSEVWLVVCPELVAYEKHEHPSKAGAEAEARCLARNYPGNTFLVARISTRITQPNSELVEEKL